MGEEGGGAVNTLKDDGSPVTTDGEYDHLKSFTTTMTFVGALLALAGLYGSFKPNMAVKKKVDQSRKLALGRAIMGGSEAILTSALVKLLYKEVENIDKRIDRIKQLREALVTKSTKNNPIPRPFLRETQGFAHHAYDFVFKFILSFFAYAKMADLSALPQVCISENREINEGCQCAKDKSCFQFTSNLIPNDLQKDSSVLYVLKTTNKLMKGDMGPHEIDLLKMYKAHEDLKKLYQNKYNYLAKIQLQKGKKIPSLNQLMDHHIHKNLQLVLHNQGKDLIAFAGSKGLERQGPSVLSSVPAMAKAMKEIAPLTTQGLPDEHEVEVAKAQIEIDHDSAGNNENFPKKQYIIHSISKDPSKSIWKIIGHRYQMVFKRWTNPEENK